MHLLICDDDARFAARVEQKVRDELAQRGIPAQITVCTRARRPLPPRIWSFIKWRCWTWTLTP